MRNLKYAILGLLLEKNMSGYEIKTEFEKSLTEFWYAKHSQIYPELKKLTEEGMTEFITEITGNVLEKKVYSITEKGKEDFMNWIIMDEDISTPKDVFRLRLFFSHNLDLENRLELIENQLKKHEKKLNKLKKEQEKFKNITEKNNIIFADYLILMGAVMREETYCSWLKKCIELYKH